MGVCTVCQTFHRRLRTSTHCNDCYLQLPPNEQVNNDNDVIEEIAIDGTKSLNELCVDDLIKIINGIIKPVKDNISTITADLSLKVNAHENRLKLLESDCERKQARIEALESVVIEMQKSINMIDQDKRKSNIIVTGLPETAVTMPSSMEGCDPVTIENDTDKVSTMLSIISQDEQNFNVNEWDISRIGKPRQGGTRALKIIMSSPEERDDVLSIASKLKTAGDTWKKVYIKKDLHPVYIKENNRIRKKRYDLVNKYKYNRENHEVQIVRGELKVDGYTVDKNLFFV